MPKYIEDIITALFSGEASEAEANILREWVDASAENAQLLDEYRKTDFAVTCYARNSRYNTAQAWKKVVCALRKASSGRLRRRTGQMYRYAAIFVLAFGAGVATMYFHATPETPETGETDIFFTEYTVPYGSRSVITLPDSSRIWINAGSKLRYSADFNQGGREVFIEGEAYFRVARNERKPFFVKTSAVTLKVLGTSFNVKAYPEENLVETTVESGSVQVLRNVAGHLSDRLVLTAGQKVTVVRSERMDSLQISGRLPSPAPQAMKSVMPEKVAEKTVVTKNVVTELYTSWKDPRWLIEKESLESLAVKLERRYDVHISFAGESLKSITFSGTLLNETLEQVLEAVKLSAPVNYSIHKNTVKLSANRWIANDNNE